jgi:excisionase family DNA binding protein
MPKSHNASPPPLISRHALRIPQAAQFVGGTPWLIEELIRNGEIPFRVIGKYRVLDADDLDAWLQAQPKRRIMNKKEIAA